MKDGKNKMNSNMCKTAKPFVKWVGGKTQLIDDINLILPPDFSHRKNVVYVEPFVGGGAVLFWILQQYPNIKSAVINDINSNLITTYNVVKNKPFELVKMLKKLQNEYMALAEEDRKEYFLAKRHDFNFSVLSEVELASLFVFLNRTCFNGLYRVNTKGFFNVPHGKYANPKICDENTIMADSALLQKVQILCGDFAETAKYASENTLFYFDPPYKPLSKTSSFNSYTKEGFDDGDQIRLRDFCHEISSKDAAFILSNSDVREKNENNDFFDDIYSHYHIKRVMASRMINSNPNKRGKLSELMVSNFTVEYSKAYEKRF